MWICGCRRSRRPDCGRVRSCTRGSRWSRSPPRARAQGMTLAAGPRTLRVFGAGFSLQEPTVESPLPGGVATVARFVLNLPSWVQITALALGIAAAVVVVALVGRRRAAIQTWG